MSVVGSCGAGSALTFNLPLNSLAWENKRASKRKLAGR